MATASPYECGPRPERIERMLAESLFGIIFPADHNTATVMFGATMLGIGAGVVGTFSCLRRQALISDAISHSTLPGVALGFLVALAVTGHGRNLPILIAGAALSGAVGILVVQWIRDATRLTEDAAIGTVLSVFFGLGIVLMSHIQALPSGGQAGLNSFLLGSSATMTADEAKFIAGAAIAATALTVFFMKEFGAVCFDPVHAAGIGIPVRRLDLLMTGLLLAIVAIGLRTAGLVLIIALVIIPPVTARFWTDRLPRMLGLSGCFGGLACYAGSAISAMAPEAPTGAVIVMVSGLLFTFSLLVAPRRGIVGHAWRALGFRRRVLLRRGLIALSRGSTPDPLARIFLRRSGLIDRTGMPTRPGRQVIEVTVRDLALWERYLTDYPDEATGLREWGTRPIGELLPVDLVATLEQRVTAQSGGSSG